MVTGIGVLLVQTNNMQRSIQFYRDVLGLHVNYESEHWSEVILGGVRLGLHTPLGHDAAKNVRGQGWIVGVEVDDIVAMREAVQSAGCWTSEAFHDIPGGVLFDFEDPDGYPMQATQQGLSVSDLRGA
jgi:predicted enzyme related to lactoylglutathione lyase